MPAPQVHSVQPLQEVVREGSPRLEDRVWHQMAVPQGKAQPEDRVWPHPEGMVWRHSEGRVWTHPGRVLHQQEGTQGWHQVGGKALHPLPVDSQ